ncbi:hypothetical protein A2368_02475 [Candidatus Collierbacteria bacterium RIFOXYB1_FULL_49_13]|uniref:phenylalanine--tRNA ligase n=1 Tax=Candidatus Collierbacteria bacterium RIFOXYB1_FULL_49_13 TaxID=1817728 RepID=A0A1F5FJU3_9BACT|nr:MAG: hypothetical protein A2368_02475 [Candidatus Collierbacteria bacterium RIFOXYB1_FULL_49_13]
MDIKLPDSLLRQYLDTPATPREVADCLSLCGPTVDRLHQTKTDSVYDIEIITNRVDSASALGVAREAAAILPQFGFTARLKNDPYIQPDQFPPGRRVAAGDIPSRWKHDSPPVQVQILDHSLVSRFVCISLSVSPPTPSPQETQGWLTDSGIRPLNSIVDISNELTLRYGQPVHIFDLDKISGQKMILRASKRGEKLTTLDGVTNTLKGGDIVIEDGAGRLIDLCGIMGGQLSEVSDHTTHVLLFVMTYAAAPIRRSSLYLQKRTLAAQLFEKQLDERLVLPTLIHGIKLFQDRCSGSVSSSLIDIYPAPEDPTTVHLPLSLLEKVAGVNIPVHKIDSILTPLGFKVHSSSDSLKITVPTFRRFDISMPEDIIEEITRVYGYFRLPSVLPTSSLPSTSTSPLLNDEVNIKHLLTSLQFTEVYNHSLVSSQLVALSGHKTTDLISLSNPLSEEYQYLRASLIPSLLQSLSVNLGKSEPPLQLFELANIYLPAEKLPQEISTTAVVSLGVDYLHFKGLLDVFFERLHLHPTFSPAGPHHTFTATSLKVSVSGQVVGYLGQIKPETCLKLSINQPVLAMEVNSALLSTLLPRNLTFKPIPLSTPPVRDITISSKKPVSDLLDQLNSFDPAIYEVVYLYSHQDKHTFRIQLYRPSGIAKKEIDSLLAQIASKIN